jgi:transitional endoplasmic reticulum ATPase
MNQDSHATERVVSQMLAEMSGLEEMKDVVVLAATNRPDILDPALLRPGRFDRHILVPTPDREARLEILKLNAKDMPLDGISLEELADNTDGYSGADIESICREAAIAALRKNMDSKRITKADFDESLQSVKPSVSDAMNNFYRSILRRKKEQKPEEDIEYIR